MWPLLVVSKAHARALVARWPGMFPFLTLLVASAALQDAPGGARKTELGGVILEQG